MALPGRKPKPENQQRNKYRRPMYEYREFADVPNPHPRRLPPVAELRACTGLKEWPAFTKRWWRSVSRLPHTTVWTDAEWEYAYEAAMLHARYATGCVDRVVAELRLRSNQLGATWQGRMDLRIRYRNDQGEEIRQDHDPTVTAMENYRKAVQ